MCCGLYLGFIDVLRLGRIGLKCSFQIHSPKRCFLCFHLSWTVYMHKYSQHNTAVIQGNIVLQLWSSTFSLLRPFSSQSRNRAVFKTACHKSNGKLHMGKRKNTLVVLRICTVVCIVCLPWYFAKFGSLKTESSTFDNNSLDYQWMTNERRRPIASLSEAGKRTLPSTSNR